MKKLWRLFKGKEEEKRLEAIQIEVSAKCNLRCTFCPTTFYCYEGKDSMDLQLYEKIVPYFSWSNWVYLQGWGESLLHKDFWQMVQLAKATGTRVGFTTNGTLLDKDAVAKILESGVDLISVSIAGATEDTHNKLRAGSSLEQIGNNIKDLLKERQAGGLYSPKVSISYMLTKENIRELPEALKMVIEWGVNDLYTTHLDYVFNTQVDDQKIFGWEGREEDSEITRYQEYFKTAIELASKEKFSFRHSKLAMKEQDATCELNPSKFIFITASGEVTPCSYLSRTENPRVFCQKLYSFPCHSFGNIQELDLGQILEGEGYRNFTQPFKKRDAALAKLLYVYGDCEPSLVRIQEAEKEYNQQFKDNPLPMSCQGCPKSYGI